MSRAIEETDRRRAVQAAYNRQHGLEPQTVKKVVRETVRSYDAVAEVVAQYSAGGEEKAAASGLGLRLDDIPLVIDKLEKQMKEHARAMEFERAAEIRDEITELRRTLGLAGGSKIGQDKRKLPAKRR